MADRRPGQVVGVLAFDQVRPKAFERALDRAVAQHQPVMRAARDMGRGDRHGDRPFLLDDFVARSRDDHQMAMRRRLEYVAPLVQQIGPYPAADVRPALRQVAE